MKFRVLFMHEDRNPDTEPWQDMGCDFSAKDAKTVLWSLANQGMQVKLRKVEK